MFVFKQAFLADSPLRNHVSTIPIAFRGVKCGRELIRTVYNVPLEI